MFKRRNLLDGDFTTRRTVDGRAHDTVRALTDYIEDLVLRAYKHQSITSHVDDAFKG